MSTPQQTISPLDETSEAGPNEQTEAVMTVQDASQSVPGDPMTGCHGIIDCTAETILQPKRVHPPAWPTSKAGPQATSPLLGQKLHPMRTDQMVYECYDQERGMPCCIPPPTQLMREKRTRTYLPDSSLQEGASEGEAIERWLDDGGT